MEQRPSVWSYLKSPTPPYIRVESVLVENPISGQPTVFERLLRLAEGKVVLNEDRGIDVEQRKKVRDAIKEMRAFSNSVEPDYRGYKIDLRYGKSDHPMIKIQGDWKDPFGDQRMPPMFQIQLVAANTTLTEEEHEGGKYSPFQIPGKSVGMTVNIAFNIDKANRYRLTVRCYSKNDPRQGHNDPRNIVETGELSSLTSRTYEIIRPIINGYRELAAQDRTVDGGERVIKGHKFKFDPLP